MRFGQVDLYNNYFYQTDEKPYSYPWGVGVQSAIYAENNFLLRSADLELDALVYDLGRHRDHRDRHPGPGRHREAVSVSLVGEYNGSHDPDLGTDAGWTPALRGADVDRPPRCPSNVTVNSGAGRL